MLIIHPGRAFFLFRSALVQDSSQDRPTHQMKENSEETAVKAGELSGTAGELATQLRLKLQDVDEIAGSIDIELKENLDGEEWLEKSKIYTGSST